MCSIAMFIREVLCEMILRDVELLTLRYIKKMRKSFSRMYWDEDGGGTDVELE